MKGIVQFEWEFGILVVILFMIIFNNVVSAEERATGWQCPAGTCDRNASGDTGDWHGYTGNGPAYGFHVGIDFMRDVNYPVYAIAHGIVVDDSDSLGGYGNACGANGGAMLVRHVAKGHDGYSRTFYALYGHMHKSSNLTKGDIVEKGEIIGNIHYYSGPNPVCNQDWTHLHFGIRPDRIDPSKPFRGIADSIASDNGWTHPINFLDDNFPAAQEVSCSKLADKYPNEMANKSCVQAFYEPPNQYQVWEYWWQGDPPVIHPSIMKATTFQIGSGHLTEIAINYGDPSVGYGGGGLPPAPGDKPDITPDFDILHKDGHEISSNCDNCPMENVQPNQVIVMRLEAQTNNRDVKTSDLFDSNSQSIDGEIWCRVRGITDWKEIPGSEDVMEFDVDNLVTEDNTSLETLKYTVPNYPGEILDCKANVDSDNEVDEQSENNNDSRVESFFIEESQSSSEPSDYANSPCGKAGYTIEECAALWFKVMRMNRQ